MKILIRSTNWIGDVVMSLPALRAVHTRYPDAEIVVLAKPWVAAVYEGERAVSRIIPLAGASGPRDFSAKWRTASLLRHENFDLAVIFPNSLESAAVVMAGGAARRVGYARDGRSFLLTDAIPLPKPGEIPRHERYYYLELLRRAGIIDELPQIDEIRLDGAPEARTRGLALFAAKGLKTPVVGVSPGAAFGGAKRWLPERFAESAATLARHLGASHLSASIAVFGSAAERTMCQQVAAACHGHNFAGATTLREFLDLTAACSAFLTNDSGAMHIAAGMGVPSVTVFGPTDETGTGPSGKLSRLVRVNVDCAPCKLRECPIDHRCMKGVTSELVVREALSILQNPT